MTDDDDGMADRQVAYDQAVDEFGPGSMQAQQAENMARGLVIDARPGLAVFQAINDVQAALASTGIGKGRKNQQQGYAFRGIDDVYNVVSPLMARHHLCMLPRMLTRTSDERQTKSGGSLNYVVVEAEFKLVSAVDGSHCTVRTFGEAMDSADKATNKAMSAALKYALLETFLIPTEGDNDADATTHDVEPMMLTKALRAIQGAASMDVLRAHFEAAYLALPPESQQALIRAKDARKAQLEGMK